MGEDATKIPCFAIGGPYGLNAAVRRQSRFVLSFGPMTLPHELARILLLEQLYRAGSIERNLPYHHEQD
jgi:23S rRNA (pseudouridine1915-N3)-methyltransferase